MVIDLADGKFTGQTRDMQSIGISHDSYLISFYKVMLRLASARRPC